MIDEDQKLQLECLASYIAELSLLKYSMLCYASLIAASANSWPNSYFLPQKDHGIQPYDITPFMSPLIWLTVSMIFHRLFCANNDLLYLQSEKYSLHKVFQFADKYREALSNGQLKRTVSPFYYSRYGYHVRKSYTHLLKTKISKLLYLLLFSFFFLLLKSYFFHSCD